MSKVTDQSDYAHLLAGIPLFNSLPKGDLATFAKELQLIEVPAGEIIFEEGQVGEHFYVVLEGTLLIVKHMGLPGEERLAKRGVGEFIGEMSLLNRAGIRMASVISEDQAKLLEITRKQFDDMLSHHPLTAYEMVHEMGPRLTDAHEKSIHNLMQKNVELTEAYDALKVAQGLLVEKERLERELELAADIQQSLLPQQLPKFDGYDFYAILKAARTVGGDLYDFIPIDSENVGLVIGDVTDKGVPAALLMAQAQTLLRSEAGPEQSPVQVLLSANDYLYTHNDGDQFITVLYGILHLPSGKFHYARAGHEAPWICTPDGSAAEALHNTGQPLGILDEPAIDEQVVEIPPGGCLLLHTDGFVDNLGGREQCSQLIEKPLRQLVESSAQEVCDTLIQQVLEYRGEKPLIDDLTLLVVRKESN